MKKTRRLIISLLLGVLMCMTVFCTFASAAPRLNKTSIALNVQKTYTLTVSGTSAKVTWASSNKSVATVTTKGVVKGIKKGTCNVTATVGKTKLTCKVTVKQPVTGIKLNKTSVSVVKGKTYTLKATVSPSTANNKAVTWKSSNTKVATVSSSGVVKGIAKGTATITATAKDGSGKMAACKVTVTQPSKYKIVSVAENTWSPVRNVKDKYYYKIVVPANSYLYYEIQGANTFIPYYLANDTMHLSTGSYGTNYWINRQTGMFNPPDFPSSIRGQRIQVYRCLKPGTYYFQAGIGQGGTSISANYRIKYRLFKNASLSNNDASTAISLSPNKQAFSYLPAAEALKGTKKWYKINLTNSQKIRIWGFAEEGLDLYNSKLQQVELVYGSVDNYYVNNELAFRAYDSATKLPAGTYYIAAYNKNIESYPNMITLNIFQWNPF